MSHDIPKKDLVKTRKPKGDLVRPKKEGQDSGKD